jgi:hypothetical protein
MTGRRSQACCAFAQDGNSVCAGKGSGRHNADRLPLRGGRATLRRADQQKRFCNIPPTPGILAPPFSRQLALAAEQQRVHDTTNHPLGQAPAVHNEAATQR